MSIHAILKVLKHSCIVLALVFSGVATAQNANIVLVNLDGANEGFNSTAAAIPGQTGNGGSNLGAQRLAVFQAAADYWEEKLVSNVTVRVEINFDPLSCDASSATLGSAGPNSVFRDFPSAPEASTWYVEAVANSRAGSDLDAGSNDIGARFNSSIDNNNNCLSNTNWWYGIDSPAPANTISLYDTVLHEIGHGIGFLSLVDSSTGVKFSNLDDAYMRYLVDNSTGVAWPNMTNAQRVASAIDTGDLVWNGPNANSNSSHLTAGKVGGRIRMYAPNPLRQGSSVSHWDTALVPDELMEPFATNTSDDTSTIQLLKDIGWQIVEGPGEIGFGSAGYRVAENFSPARITLRRVGGSAGAASVNVSTTDGTATAGLDYTATNQVVSWADGDSATKTVFIAVEDDGIEELGGEVFTVAISNLVGDATVGRTSANVQILDPDTDDFLLSVIPAILAATSQPDEPAAPPPTVNPLWSVANDVCCPTSAANFTVARGSDRRNSVSPSCNAQSAQSSEAGAAVGANSFSYSMTASGCGTVNGSFSTTFRESTRYLFVAVLDGGSIGVDLYSQPFRVASTGNEVDLDAEQNLEEMTLEESISIPLADDHSYQSKSTDYQSLD